MKRDSLMPIGAYLAIWSHYMPTTTKTEKAEQKAALINQNHIVRKGQTTLRPTNRRSNDISL